MILMIMIVRTPRSYSHIDQLVLTSDTANYQFHYSYVSDREIFKFEI